MGNRKYKGRFFENFMILHDPRQEGKIRHKLIDVLFIGVAASLCGCNEWDDMELWAQEREGWLRRHLELLNGIPSCDTIERVFDFIEPIQFEKCFAQWMKEITDVEDGGVVALDGKTVRGAKQKGNAKSNIHIVSAWSSRDKLVLGQVKTDEKSNEITAIPELLDLLFLKGCIVTIDAMGCQKDIARKIVEEKKADYVLSLKDNHPLLKKEAEDYFIDTEKDGFNSSKIETNRTINKGHGRIEERIYYYSKDINWLEDREKWAKLKGIGMVIRKVEKDGVKTEERAYHLSSVKTAEDYAKGARLHWGIESMHWGLDVTFREDANRTRKGKAAVNLALLKRLSMNMMRKDQEMHPKRSLRKKRFTCSLNSDYLDYILRINLK